MPIDLVWSKAAREQLLELYLAIGLSNPKAAERLYERIEKRVQQLARQPQMGRRRPDIRRGARVLIVSPYLILYEINPETGEGPVQAIEVVGVIDGRRDLPQGS